MSLYSTSTSFPTLFLLISLFISCSTAPEIDSDLQLEEKKDALHFFFPYAVGDSLLFAGSSTSDNDSYLVYEVYLEESWVISKINFEQDSLHRIFIFDVTSNRDIYHFYCDTPYSNNCNEIDSTSSLTYEVELVLSFEEQLVVFDYPENEEVIVTPPFYAGRGTASSLDTEFDYNFMAMDTSLVSQFYYRDDDIGYGFDFKPNKGIEQVYAWSSAHGTSWGFSLRRVDP